MHESCIHSVATFPGNHSVHLVTSHDVGTSSWMRSSRKLGASVIIYSITRKRGRQTLQTCNVYEGNRMKFRGGRTDVHDDGVSEERLWRLTVSMNV